MSETLKIEHTKPFTPPEVAGVRILGKNRVYWFREICDQDGALDIGRTDGRSIRIRDRSVSIQHCVIRPGDEGEYEILDAYSTNGVRVSDRPGLRPFEQVYHCVLEVGLHIKLGRIRLVVVGHDGQPPLIAKRPSQFGRLAFKVYGRVTALVKTLGFTRHWARLYKRQQEALEEGSQP